MFTLITEQTQWGTVQHFETRNHELSVCVYEQALKAGLEPETGKNCDGSFYVDFYAEDETFTAVYRAAQEEADERRLKAVEAARNGYCVLLEVA